MSFRNLCFIPAKGASTRLPKKNLLKIDGEELLFYPIKAAKKSNLFSTDDIIVSTESEEVKKVAQKHGANVPYLREDHLARDPYGVSEVAFDFLESFKDYQKYDYIFFLLPTSPLTQSGDILNGFDLIRNEGFETVMSVTETEHNALRSNFVKNGRLEPIHPEMIKKKSQELEKTYHINGAVIVVKMSAFLEHRSYYTSSIGAFEIPRNRSVDIDTYEDFMLAEYLFSQM
ncbi:MAG: acylneuraminate cytidylyltransferase family protein [Bacteroidota bacterium]